MIIMMDCWSVSHTPTLSFLLLFYLAAQPPVCWQDLMSIENDFPSKAHCLSRWYGLRTFLVLGPGPSMDDVMTESRANMVLSSVSVALNSTSW